MAELSDELKDLLATAVDLPADEAGPFLDQQLKDRPADRAEIDSLLRSHRQARRFLDPPSDQRSFSPSEPLDGGIDPISFGPGSESDFDRYRLLDILGEGGFGVVYRAEQLRPIRRTVALKVTKAGMESRAVMGRFDLERQVLASMDHPNIARLLDAGTTDQGRPYFVMELVDGLPITAHADKSGMSQRERIALFIPVCRAVHHAHRKGVLHRDLKPSNILVGFASDQPETKVIDFGIAKAISEGTVESPNLTQHRQLVGTPRYMSPEQSSFNSAGIDTRSDVYSLGAVLHELVTGNAPSAATAEPTSGAFAHVASAAAVPPATVGDLTGLPRELCWIVRKAIESDRHLRYDSAAELGDDLENFLSGRPVKAGPPGMAYLARKFAARHKTVVVLGIIVTVLLALSVIAQTAALSRLRVSQNRTATAERTLQLAEHDEVERLRDSYLLQARAGSQSRRVGQRFASVAAVEAAVKIRPDADFRNELIAALATPDLEHVRTWHALPGTKILEISPDHEHYVEWSGGQKMRVALERDHSTCFSLPDARRDQARFVFDSSGKYLLAGYSDPAVGIVVFDVAAGREIFRPPDKSGDSCFTGDGRAIAVGLPSGDIDRFELPSGKQLPPVHAGGQVERIICSPTSDVVAVFGQDKEVRLFHFDPNGGGSSRLPMSYDSVSAMAFSPDGRLLAVGGTTVDLFDCQTGLLQASFTDHVSNPFSLCFADGGRLLISGSWDGKVRVWDVGNGQLLLTCFGSDLSQRPSPDSSIFLFSSVATTEQWRLVPSPICQFFSCFSLEGGTEVATFTRDNQRLIATTYSGVRCWSLSTGLTAGYLSIPTARTPVLIDNDSRMLLTTRNGLLSIDVAELTRRNDPTGKLSDRGGTSGLGVSADGQTAVFTDVHGGVRLADTHDVQHSTVIGRTQNHGAPRNLAISPDGNWALTADRLDKSVEVWNLRERKWQTRLLVDASATETGGVAISPDGRTAITADAAAYYCWSIPGWTPLWVKPRKDPITHGMVAFSHDGKFIAADGPACTILLLNSASGEPFASLAGPTDMSPTQYAFSEDDSMLAVCGAGGVRVWQIKLIRDQLGKLGLDW